MSALKQTCIDLISKNHAFDITYGRDLFNHASMAIIALEGMGATEQQLTRFFENYCAQLNPFELKPVTTSPSPPEKYFGDASQLSLLIRFYTQAISKHGVEEALRQHLPALTVGLGSAAFHGLIRTAYAIESGMESELAFALAAWAVRFQDLGTLPKSRIDATLTEQLTLLNAIREKTVALSGNIGDRMLAASQWPNVISANLQPESIQLSDMADLAIQLYVETGNFILLHGVTGCHALRVILPFLDNHEIAMHYYWRHLCLAYLVSGSKRLIRANHEPVPNDWGGLLELACEHHDDHTIKMTYSCWQEHQVYGAEKYLQAAQIALS